MTCLHFAVWCNHVDTVKLCLSLGAELGLEGTWLDYTGTPLDFAQQFRHKVRSASFQCLSAFGIALITLGSLGCFPRLLGRRDQGREAA